MSFVDNNSIYDSITQDDFIELIESIENDLYNIARNKFSNTQDIDDVLQETTIQIYKNLHKLKDPNSFKAWATKILINECKKIHKANYKNTLLLDKIKNKTLYTEADLSITHFENNLCFSSLLKSIEPIEQNIFQMYYQFNYSTKEISKLLKINENTVKSKLKRNKSKIKQKIMESSENI